MKEKINSLFSLLLLLYFAGFAVAPVSAVLPSDRAADIGKDQDVLEKRSGKTAVFFYDLVLWEALQKVKRSDDSKKNIIEEKNSDNAPDTSSSQITLGVTGSGNGASIPVPGIPAYCNFHISTVQQYAYFDRSGLSPPFPSITSFFRS